MGQELPRARAVERFSGAAGIDQHPSDPGGVTKFLDYFPDRIPDPILIDRFNEEMGFQYDTIRDFIIAHYKVTEREDTPYWQYCKHMSIPDSLAEKLELFRRRGEARPRAGDLFSEVSWFAILYGQGIVPQSTPPPRRCHVGR